MTGSSIEQVRKEAEDKYGEMFKIVDVKYDRNKKVSASAILMGNTKYYRVYLKPN